VRSLKDLHPEKLPRRETLWPRAITRLPREPLSATRASASDSIHPFGKWKWMYHTAPSCRAKQGSLALTTSAVWLRGRYPARVVAEGRHRVRCVVPEGVARLAEVRPQLIAAAVHALYTRGPEDVRAATSRARFGRERMVPCTLRMTRCLYAQLAKQVPTSLRVTRIHLHRSTVSP
jgi:hypothetical protein